MFAELPLGIAFKQGEHPICTHSPISYRQTAIQPYLLGDSGYKLMRLLIVQYNSVKEGRDAMDHLRTFNFSTYVR